MVSIWFSFLMAGLVRVCGLERFDFKYKEDLFLTQLKLN